MSISPSPYAFVSGSSWLHRASALPKLAWLVAALAFCVAVLNPAPLLGVLAVASLLAVSCGLGGQLWRAMGVLGPIAGSIIVLQVAAPASCLGGCTQLATFGPVTITAEALGRGVAYVLRLLAMASVGVLVLVTTRPADLFGALQRLRVPHPVALVLATTMDLVPLLSSELAVVLDAQRARGLRATGLQAVVPALVPVFVAVFEQVGRRAISMEARGYGSSVARTSYRTTAFGPRERTLAWAGLGAGIVGVIAGLAFWGSASVPAVVIPGWAAVGIVIAAVAAFLAVIGRALASFARA